MMLLLKPIPVFACSFLFAFYSCSDAPGKSSVLNTATADSISLKKETKDSTAEQKKELTKFYTQAISAFIKAANKEHNIIYDTLHFAKRASGQADDFPDIRLPETIENTKIRLISPEEGKKLQEERKSRVYINLVGWVNKTTAEFIFIVFSNGFAHQYDYHILYERKKEEGEFSVSESRFEFFGYKEKK